MSDSLIPVESVNGIELFTGAGKLDDLLARIRQETITLVPNVETLTGRKEIASIAYKVARSKTVIDDAGKALVSEWKAKSATVDAERKKARDYLDALKDEVRQPLDEWEAEQARIEREKAEAEAQAKAAEEAAARAELERREAEVRAREEAIAKAEADRLKKERDEQAERDRVALEELVRKDVEVRAQREAVEAIARAEAETAAALQREKDAAERAEREKAEAVRQAEERARLDADAKERARLAEVARAEAEEQKRAANREHRKRINNAALAALEAEGVPAEVAKQVITLIASGVVPAVSINY